jgi:hypothetical protein
MPARITGRSNTPAAASIGNPNQMRYARLLSKLYAEPLLLQPAAWHAFDHALRSLMEGNAPSLPQAPVAKLHDDNPDLYDEDDTPRSPVAKTPSFRGVLDLMRLAPDSSQSFNGEAMPNDTAIITFRRRAR